ncbi:MAG: hypothetical protein ABSB01_18530 [Streptosporangiaceae bacterium]
MRTRPQHAPEFSGSRQIRPVPGPEQEVLAFGWRIVAQRPQRAGVIPGIRKTVIGIGPRGCLFRVTARDAHPAGEPGQPEPAALADPRERLTIAAELQGYLIGLPGAVTAGNWDNRENGAINAT